MLFDKIYNRVNHLIHSVQNHNKWFMKLETSNCVNWSTRNPKRSAKYVYILGQWHRLLHVRALLAKKKRGKTEIQQNTRWTYFQFPTKSKREDDLTDTDTVRIRETRNITLPISWKSARRRTSKVSMTDLYEMNNSAIDWLKMVETKMFVDKWMILRTKIIATICHHKNTTITEVTGGFVLTR